MINNTINDESQKVILPVLSVTEELILQALKKESGREEYAEIVAMPDLGLASNSIRMRGGFFTGMFLEWTSRVPFVPVDATVNSCGIAIFELKEDITVEDFKDRITRAKDRIKSIKYNWNFERGNHFISLCKLNKKKNCIVMHASADEYKRSISGSSLYPELGVWYYDTLKVIEDHRYRDRYLRYLSGDPAEKFSSIAIALKEVNHKRMGAIANLIVGDIIDEEVMYVPHYGMPSPTSIAIGCSWQSRKSILLTAPGKEFYMIRQKKNTNNGKWLTPHGLGVVANPLTINYKKKSLIINDTTIGSDEDVKKISERRIRFCYDSKDEYGKHINQVLSACNAEIDNRFQPIASISKDGFMEYNNF